MTFVEILDTFGIAYVKSGHRHAREGWVQIDCPYCGRDTEKFHLGYNLSQGYCNCWHCGKKNVRSVLYEYLGRERGKEIEEALTHLTINLSESIKFEGRANVRRPKNTGKLLKQHIQYLKARGFTKRDAHLWELKGIPVSIGFNWRIYIPIFYRGKEVSFTTRSIRDSAAQRYISASDKDEVYPHKKVLFGEQFARDSIIITEGPFDAMRIGPGAVACCGTSYTPDQVLEMSKYPTRVVCFDTEDTAQHRARELGKTLSLYKGDTYVVTLDSGDAGSATKEEITELRNNFIEGVGAL